MENEKQDTTTERFGDAVVGAGILALLGWGLFKAFVKNTSDDQERGWGKWKSREHGGAVCPYHARPTTKKDGSEYWCPTCWTESMLTLSAPDTIHGKC